LAAAPTLAYPTKMRQVQAVEEALRETRRRPHAWPLSHGTLGPPEHPDRQLLRRHPRYHARARADRAVAQAAASDRGSLFDLTHLGSAGSRRLRMDASGIAVLIAVLVILTVLLHGWPQDGSQ